MSRPTPREPRLQRQLLAWLLAPLMVLLVLDTAVTYWTSHNFANLAHDRSLHELAREIALHVKPANAGLELDLTPAAERILLVDPHDRLFYRVSREDGKVIGGNDVLGAPPSLLSKGGRPLFYNTQLHGEEVRAVAWWVAAGEGQPAQMALIQVAETVTKREQLAWDILVTAIVPQLLLIVMATGAVVLGVTRGIRPLRRLAHAVSHRSHRDLSPIDTHGVPGEVRPLVDEVNDLMLRVGKILDFQTRFVADAAHQLKTPVSGLKAQIELALREEDPQRVRHSLAQLYVGADRLSRLVLQLLALARNEPDAARSLQMEALDLRELAMQATMEWVPLAIKADIDLGFEGREEPVMIEADADRVRLMLNNLVDNAIRYSQHGGRVTVAVERVDSGHARLSISDDGRRIPVEERSRIFERFHRLLGTQMDGSGLGLAIVSEIAALHSAQIELEDDGDGVGNRFSVLFPIFEASESGDPALQGHARPV